MTNAKAERVETRLVALVRNKDGKPQFNDFNNIPEVFHPQLSKEDWVYIKSRQEA